MVTLGVLEPPKVDLEQFLSMIRFDARGKLNDFSNFFAKSVRVAPGFFNNYSQNLIAVRVQYRPLESFDDSVERFFATLRFEQRDKLDQFYFELDK